MQPTLACDEGWHEQKDGTAESHLDPTTTSLLVAIWESHASLKAHIDERFARLDNVPSTDNGSNAGSPRSPQGMPRMDWPVDENRPPELVTQVDSVARDSSVVHMDSDEYQDPSGDWNKIHPGAIQRPTSFSTMAEKLQHPPQRRWLDVLVSSNYFECVCGLVILLNAAYLALQIQGRAAYLERGEEFQESWILTYCFNGIFTLELFCRVGATGRYFFMPEPFGNDKQTLVWNYFDIVIVTGSWLDALAERFPPLRDTFSNNISVFRLLRIVRVFRVMRIVRVLNCFRELRIMVSSIFATLSSLVWAMLLLCMIMFVFAIVFTDATVRYAEERPDDDVSDLLEQFGHIASSLRTLFKSITGGNSWEVASYPLSRVHWAYESLFFVFVAFALFAVMNVMTGVFCQSAIESAQQDEQEVIAEHLTRKKEHAHRLEQLFCRLNSDGDMESLSFAEFTDSLKDPAMEAYFQTLNLDVADAQKLFRLLDSDNTGQVDINEFVEGCLNLRGGASNVDMALMMRQMSSVLAELRHFQSSFLTHARCTDLRHKEGRRHMKSISYSLHHGFSCVRENTQCPGMGRNNLDPQHMPSCDRQEHRELPGLIEEVCARCNISHGAVGSAHSRPSPPELLEALCSEHMKLQARAVQNLRDRIDLQAPLNLIQHCDAPELSSQAPTLSPLSLDVVPANNRLRSDALRTVAKEQDALARSRVGRSTAIPPRVTL